MLSVSCAKVYLLLLIITLCAGGDKSNGQAASKALLMDLSVMREALCVIDKKLPERPQQQKLFH